MMDSSLEKRAGALLIFIVLVGIGLRFYQLDAESLWTDEAVSLAEAKQKTLPAVSASVYENELLPPGYFIILHYWIKMFGTSEFSIRGLSLLFGVASIVLMYMLAAYLFDKKTGLIASLLISTAMLQVLYSQEARPYMLFGFLVMLSTYYLARAMNKPMDKEKKANGGYFFFYAGTTLIALYINYMMLFVIFFQTIPFYFERYRQLRRRWLYTTGAILVLGLPLVPYMIGQVANKYHPWVDALPSYGIPLFLSKLGVFFFLLPVMGVVLLVLLSLIILKHRQPSFKQNAFIYALMIGGILYVLSLNYMTRSITVIRHSYFLVLIIYLAMARGMVLIKNKKLWITLLTLILLFNVFVVSVYYVKTTKAPWREAVSFIEQSNGSSLVIFDRGGSNIALFTYYTTKDFRTVDIQQEFADSSAKGEEKKLNEMLSKEKRGFWFISSRNVKNKGYYRNLLENNFNRTIIQQYKDIEIVYFN